MSVKQIQIVSESWSYDIVGGYTYIYDEDGDDAITLRWKANEGEIKAAAYGYGAGLRVGRKCGEATKLAEIQRALGI